MPIIEMADGQQVEVPENPTPELKEKIRLKNEQIKAGMGRQQQPQPAPPRQSAAPQPTLDRALAQQEPPKERTFGEALGNVGAAALGGAVTGFATPEVLAGAGKVLSAVPYAPVAAAGRGMQAAAPLAAGFGARAGGAAVGALSGATGQTVEQTLEGTLPPVYAKTAGLAASLLVPSAERALGYIMGGVGTAWKGVKALAEGADQNISAAVKSAKAALSSEPFAREPQIAVSAALAKSAAQNIAKAKAEAQALEAKAREEGAKLFRTDPQAASRLLAQAKAAGATAIAKAQAEAKALQMASATDLTKAAQIKAKADGELAKIAPVVPPSDTGNLIRGKIVPEMQGKIQAKNAAYKAQEALRDEQVAAKEAAGEFMDSDPGYKELVRDLYKKLHPGKGGTKLDVTDPGVRGAYEKLYEALRNHRMQVGVDAEGNPLFKTFKTSFEAADAVRRRLGEVAYGGTAPEGYGAIGKKLAGEWYGKLTEAQVRYAPAQRELQSEYSTALEGLAGFKVGRGKAATAVERLDPEAFAKDPADLPKTFFRTQQSVRDLKELTGDAGVVGAAARQHAVRELAGKDTAQVRKWLADPANRDWLREVPGLEKELQGYASNLSLIERSGAKLTERAGAATKRAGEVLPEAEALAAKALGKAEKKAGELTRAVEKERAGAAKLQKEAAATGARLLKEAQKQVAGLADNGFPVEQVNKLLRSGSPAELKMVGTALVGTPGGADALERSMRSMMVSMGPKDLGKFWSERGRDIMSGVLSGKELARLDADVTRVLRAYEGKKALSEVQRAVARALAAAGGYGIGQTGVGAAMAGSGGGE